MIVIGLLLVWLKMLRVLSGIFLAVLMQRHCTSGQEGITNNLGLGP